MTRDPLTYALVFWVFWVVLAAARAVFLEWHKPRSW